MDSNRFVAQTQMGDYTVSFHDRRATVCTIRDQRGHLIGRGVAVQNPDDPYDQLEGMQCAIRKAMKDCYYVDCFGPEECAAIGLEFRRRTEPMRFLRRSIQRLLDALPDGPLQARASDESLTKRLVGRNLLKSWSR